ncbi:protein HEATR9 [Glossophaga mutica]
MAKEKSVDISDISRSMLKYPWLEYPDRIKELKKALAPVHLPLSCFQMPKEEFPPSPECWRQHPSRSKSAPYCYPETPELYTYWQTLYHQRQEWEAQKMLQKRRTRPRYLKEGTATQKAHLPTIQLTVKPQKGPKPLLPSGASLKWQRLKELTQSLKAPREDEQFYAAQALGCLGVGDKFVIEALLQVARTGPEKVVREAYRTLAMLGCLEKDVIQALIAQLKGQNEEQRMDTLRGLRIALNSWAAVPKDKVIGRSAPCRRKPRSAQAPFGRGVRGTTEDRQGGRRGCRGVGLEEAAGHEARPQGTDTGSDVAFSLDDLKYGSGFDSEPNRDPLELGGEWHDPAVRKHEAHLGRRENAPEAAMHRPLNEAWLKTQSPPRRLLSSSQRTPVRDEGSLASVLQMLMQTLPRAAALEAALCLGFLRPRSDTVREFLLQCMRRGPRPQSMKALRMLVKRMHVHTAEAIRAILDQLCHSNVLEHRLEATQLLKVIGLEQIQAQGLEGLVFDLLRNKIHNEPFLAVRQAVAQTVEELKMKPTMLNLVEMQLMSSNAIARREAVISLGVLGVRSPQVFNLLLDMLDEEHSQSVKKSLQETLIVLASTDPWIQNKVKNKILCVHEAPTNEKAEPARFRQKLDSPEEVNIQDFRLVQLNPLLIAKASATTNLQKTSGAQHGSACYLTSALPPCFSEPLKRKPQAAGPWTPAIRKQLRILAKT